jgi:hypothetical protein
VGENVKGEGERWGEDVYLTDILLDGGAHDETCLRDLNMLLEVEELKFELCELCLGRGDACARVSARATS